MPLALVLRRITSNRFNRLVGRHPIVTLAIVFIAGIAISMLQARLAQTAYETSPAGMADRAKRDIANAEEAQIDIAKVLVRASLRDPDSARFSAVHSAVRGSDVGVCGYVNSKNGFGGMSGNQAFAVIDSKTILANDAYPKDLKQLNRLCDDR